MVLISKPRLQIPSEAIRSITVPLTGAPKDYDTLLDRIGDAHFVLLGEASHGTHEFYHERCNITKRLVQEQGFNAVAVEADWPDAYRVNQYVRGLGSSQAGLESLSGFQRFPSWMWRNRDVLDFICWLRAHNDSIFQDTARIGVYGLDLYSLYNSIAAVIQYLDKVDPEAAKRARYRYSCFETFGEDTQAYGYAARFDVSKSCEDEVVNQLTDLQRAAADYIQRDGRVASDAFFYAEQNARLVKNSEEYYRSMFGSHVDSWNLRDRHMSETLNGLNAYLGSHQGVAKIVVWEHNSHIGDARATELGDQGELNVGQLVRETYGSDSFLIGFSTYAGSVTAASEWGGPAERKRVRPALAGSYEALFHALEVPAFLFLCEDADGIEPLAEPHLERAIGVIYRPESERISHYFSARLPQQFDALIHCDRTHALEPLEQTPMWQAGEGEMETFPSGV